MSIEEKAQKVWDTAEETLRQVDDAHIFSVAKKKCRDFPTFDPREIVSGSLMGKGGFSNVFEVSEIKLEIGNNDKEEPPTTTSGNGNTVEYLTRARGEPTLAFQGTMEDVRQDDYDEEHYHIDKARELMSQRCMRFGAARYAIKRLRPDLNKLEHARGALDLAIEIKYMSVLMHPNIVKMRAYSNTPRISLDTFIIMDRLYGTLDDKMSTWISTEAMLKGCCGLSKDSAAQTDLFKERLLVAYDLTVALEHMHSLRLIYRDIKPENIGFDIRGDVKVFDFGLMKSLDDRFKAKNGGYGYNLTAFTGSIPYMAPEIALREPYDKEADVFSYSMLLWEIMSMEVLYPNYTVQDYFVRVCKQGERPTIPSGTQWPAVIKTVLQEGWSRDPRQRPNMKRIGMLIRVLLQDISSGDDSIVNRTAHMMDKSRKSFHDNLSGSGHPVTDGGGPGRRGGKKPAATSSAIMPNTGESKESANELESTRRESFHENFDPREWEKDDVNMGK